MNICNQFVQKSFLVALYLWKYQVCILVTMNMYNQFVYKKILFLELVALYLVLQFAYLGKYQVWELVNMNMWNQFIHYDLLIFWTSANISGFYFQLFGFGGILVLQSGTHVVQPRILATGHWLLRHLTKQKCIIRGTDTQTQTHRHETNWLHIFLFPSSYTWYFSRYANCRARFRI